MALKRGTTAAAAAPATFEADPADNVAVADKAAVNTSTPAQEAAAAEVASTAIAKAANTAVAAPAGKMKTVLEDLRDVIPTLDFGTLPRLTGSNGNIIDPEKRLLGDEIELTLISFNDEYVVTPGEDDDESKKHVRYSNDGIHINETGQPVADYVAHLRDNEDYPNAARKHYVQLIGILTGSKKDSDLVNQMVVVSLSPGSRKLWEGFRLQESVKVRMGLRKAEGTENLTIKAEVKTQGKNTFTLLKVSTPA